MRAPGTPTEDTDIEPDEYLWEKLPGRCCFSGYLEDPDDPDSEWIGAQVCNECNVWSEPDNFCHTSQEACEACGMRLFCATTPPLVGGNKVCVGDSRVGEGCNDELGTGVCASQGLGECQQVRAAASTRHHTYTPPPLHRWLDAHARRAQACRDNAHCEVFVYYAEEHEGSCILCRDLAHTKPTPDALTRIYATTPAPPPPSSPHHKANHFKVLSGPSPPPPPRPPPDAPSPPPRPLAHLARSASTKEHFQCSFDEKTEYSVDADTGYTDRIATSKEECCNACGLHSGCKDFVFEPSSGTCVLLPAVDDGEIIKSPNEYTVSGSISIEIVTAASLRRGDCTFEEQSGFSGGEMGHAEALPGAEPITTPQGCCDACDKEPECAKFTFESYSKACVMYAAYAERYLTAALSSGTVKGRTSRDIASRGGGSSYAAGASTVSAFKPWLDELSPPPAPPAFTSVIVKPPPPPPPGDVASTKNLMTGFSIGAFVLMMFGFTTCAFCFFGPQLLNLVYQATGGRLGRRHTGMQKLYTSDWDEKVALAASARQPPERGGRKKKKKGRVEARAGYVNVTVETAAMTQKKELCVEEIGEYAELMGCIFDEFGPLLKKHSQREMLLFCYGESTQGRDENDDDDDDEPEVRYAWLLVVSKSDIRQVLSACSALKLTEKSEGHRDGDFERAFLPEEHDDEEEDGRRRKGKKGKKAKKEGKKKGRKGRRGRDDEDDEGEDEGGDDDEKQDDVAERRREAKKTPEESLADALIGLDDNDEADADAAEGGVAEEGAAEEGAAVASDSDRSDEQASTATTQPAANGSAVRKAGRAVSPPVAAAEPKASAQVSWEDSDSDDGNGGDDAVGPIGLPRFNPQRFTAARYNEDDGFSTIGAQHMAARGGQPPSPQAPRGVVPRGGGLD